MDYTWHIVDKNGNRIILDGRHVFVQAVDNKTHAVRATHAVGYITEDAYECGVEPMLGDLLVANLNEKEN